MKNPLHVLESLGQSVWLDDLNRGALNSGELRALIQEDGVSGVTSNPSTFKEAIADSQDYDAAIREVARQGKNDEQIYQALAVQDIQNAADLLRPVYDKTAKRDGFVSLEVSPRLARDTQGTLDEARRLWAAVARPNVFIKVPGTAEGLPAIQQLISERININVTLLFGLPRYRQVAEAYIAGLESLAQRGEPLESVASVASFFLSRIDVIVDPMLQKIVDSGGAKAATARELQGQVAIASAKVAGSIYNEIFTGARFAQLADRGARPQKLLWASTGTKNPAYPDTKYVEPLIGPDTINTMPLKTLVAYRDHGQPASRLSEGVAEAHRVLQRLHELELDIDDITSELETQGITKFTQPFDALMEAIKTAREEALKRRLAA